jgi:hypothetical protein
VGLRSWVESVLLGSGPSLEARAVHVLAKGPRKADSGRTARTRSVLLMTTKNRQVLQLPPGLCRRCVRAFSRRLRDVPGMVWFEVDAAAGLLWISGDVDPATIEAQVNDLRCA